MAKNFDVIVFGGGLSGMAAAYHLKKRQCNLKILILEAKPRLGGRTLTVPLEAKGGKKANFDLGGQWVGPLQEDLLELMKELDMSDYIYPQFISGTKVAWVDPGQIITYNADLPFYNPIIYLEAYFFMRKIDKLADQLDADNPFLHNPALAEYLDSITAEAFIRENIYCSAFRELIRIGLRSAFGMEGTHMSALYLLLYGKSSGRLENVFSSANQGTQKWRVKNGTQQISERLADIVGRENIIMSAPVTAIEQNDDSVVVTAYIDGNSQRFEAKRVISAVPPNQLLPIKMTPPMPASRVELMRSMPMGNIYKFVITYETAFWREKNLSGETCCYGGSVDLSPDCPVGIACVSFDACLVDGTPALVGLMGGHQNVYWRQKTPAQRRKAILESLSKMLGDKVMKPVDFREKDWGLEQWTGGCPVNVLQPGVGRFYTSSLRLPIGNIYLAGTESAQRSCGFLSGAVQAGRRAATEVLYSLDKHSSVDDKILDMSCFGNSGAKMKAPQKWLTTADSCYTTLSRRFTLKHAMILASAYFLYRNRNAVENYFYKFLNKVGVFDNIGV